MTTYELFMLIWASFATGMWWHEREHSKRLTMLMELVHKVFIDVGDGKAEIRKMRGGIEIIKKEV